MTAEEWIARGKAGARGFDVQVVSTARVWWQSGGGRQLLSSGGRPAGQEWTEGARVLCKVYGNRARVKRRDRIK